MPKAFPLEFRQDVVARQGQASLAQVAKDFGVSESCLQRWVKLADIEDGRRPGVTVLESRLLARVNRLSHPINVEVGSATIRGEKALVDVEAAEGMVTTH